jgi:uncharacterized membrane protein YozB (DUF420 family)
MLRFSVHLTFALLVFAAAAFWPMYLSQNWAGIDRYTHAHAAFGALWMAILVVQPVLIRLGYRFAHRTTGWVALFVAVGFVISGLLLTHFRVSRLTEAAFAKEGIYIYLPLSVAVLFAIACGLGFVWRKSAAVHARFMLSTALLLVDPVLARLMFFHLPPLPSNHFYQGVSFSLIAAVMVYLANSLPRAAPGRSAYRNYGLAAAVVLGLFFAVPYTGAWLLFVNGFRALPLT